MGPGDPQWEEDRYFNPAHLASFWTSLYQAGRYDEAGDRLKDLLESHQVALPADSLEFKRLAAEGMRYAIAAFAEAERTIVTVPLIRGRSGGAGQYQSGLPNGSESNLNNGIVCVGGQVEA